MSNTTAPNVRSFPVHEWVIKLSQHVDRHQATAVTGQSNFTESSFLFWSHEQAYQLHHWWRGIQPITASIPLCLDFKLWLTDVTKTGFKEQLNLLLGWCKSSGFSFHLMVLLVYFSYVLSIGESPVTPTNDHLLLTVWTTAAITNQISLFFYQVFYNLLICL